MPISTDLPGNPQQQALLAAIVRYYAGDARVKAVILFGSLARGNADDFSDLDLDIIMRDDMPIAIDWELGDLCASLVEFDGEHALIIPNNADSGDVVLPALLQFSVRYHPLATTSPNILDSMRILAGDLTPEIIHGAGMAQPSQSALSNTLLVSKCLRWSLETHIALRRNRPWMAVELLHYCRMALMQIFANLHQAKRPTHAFEAQADADLHALMAQTLPAALEKAAITRALLGLLDILEHHLGQFGDPGLSLTREQRHILNRLRGQL